MEIWTCIANCAPSTLHDAVGNRNHSGTHAHLEWHHLFLRWLHRLVNFYSIYMGGALHPAFQYWSRSAWNEYSNTASPRHSVALICKDQGRTVWQCPTWLPAAVAHAYLRRALRVDRALPTCCTAIAARFLLVRGAVAGCMSSICSAAGGGASTA